MNRGSQTSGLGLGSGHGQGTGGQSPGPVQVQGHWGRNSIGSQISNKLLRTEMSLDGIDKCDSDVKTEAIAKLELFIVCRLEILSREDQNILRTASIIGRVFSKEILYGILSPKMRTQMFSSIASLIKNMWIVEFESPQYPRNYDAIEYTFVHPLFYQTLYDLTPAGDKARLHYAVANYIEEAFEGNPKHYVQLGRHYGVAKDCRPKALEYFCRASVYYLSLGLNYFERALQLLLKAKIFADSAMDYGSILGIITDAIEQLNDLRNCFLSAAEDATQRSTASWDNFRKQQNKLKLKMKLNRIEIAPLVSLTVVKNRSLRHDNDINNIDKLLGLYLKIDRDINLSYLNMVEINCVGVISSWQLSYLKKWKDTVIKPSINSVDSEHVKTKKEKEKESLVRISDLIPVENPKKMKLKLTSGIFYCMRKFNSESISSVQLFNDRNNVTDSNTIKQMIGSSISGKAEKIEHCDSIIVSQHSNQLIIRNQSSKKNKNREISIISVDKEETSIKCLIS